MGRVISLSFAALGNSEVREDRKNVGARMVVEGTSSFLSNLDVVAIPFPLCKRRVRVLQHCLEYIVAVIILGAVLLSPRCNPSDHNARCRRVCKQLNVFHL